jgi:group II intron reverse transcriptase/maturase
MSLSTPDTVRKLQTALHAKAKEAPDYRFYALYDKVYRADVLAFAYRCCRANAGVAGVDGQTFADIERYGVGRWLGELAEALRSKTYAPQAIRRAYIPKPDGAQRPLGIATIRDRVAQTATLLVLAPIFEADLLPEQYAYRPERSALDAVRAVHRLLNTGHTEVVDADLSGYFDTIPHAELMHSVARRVSDRHLLHLVKRWLVVPVEAVDEPGRRRRTTPNKDQRQGIPQGSPLSPLLANMYMRRFVLGWKLRGYEHQLHAYIVNYADDFVICCKGMAQQADQAMRGMMGQLKLTVNAAKTQVCSVPEDSVDFLGYTLGRCYSPKTGRAYIGTRPSKQAIRHICDTISEATQRRWVRTEVQDRVRRLNEVMIGWADYFCLGPVSKAYRVVDNHARHRLRQWLCAKHKKPGQGVARYPDTYLDQTLGLVRLEERTRNFPWANA